MPQSPRLSAEPPPCPLKGLEPLTGRVFVSFRKTFHLQRLLVSKAFAEKGMHPSEAMCVRALAERNGINQRDLADLLHLSRPRVTAILQVLEKSGAVVRRSDEGDQRLTRVFLTEQGWLLSDELHEVFTRCLGQTIGALPEEDRRELVRLLDSVADTTSIILQAGESGRDQSPEEGGGLQIP